VQMHIAARTGKIDSRWQKNMAGKAFHDVLLAEMCGSQKCVGRTVAEMCASQGCVPPRDVWLAQMCGSQRHMLSCILDST
jgi:hypothetical protein